MGTLLIDVLGSFVIGPDGRLFVVSTVGNLSWWFTTFSSFSFQL
jgi:hypothetical protein